MSKTRTYTKNPKTNRKIIVGGKTYLRLIKDGIVFADHKVIKPVIKNQTSSKDIEENISRLNLLHIIINRIC